MNCFKLKLKFKKFILDFLCMVVIYSLSIIIHAFVLIYMYKYIVRLYIMAYINKYVYVFFICLLTQIVSLGL